MDKSNKHVYIEHNGHIYFFKNTKSENSTMFMDKCWFIVKHQGIPYVEQIADVWVNKKYLKVTYPEHIEKMLDGL